MHREFDRSLFASVLVGLALLLSLTTATRFPAALRAGHADGAYPPAISLTDRLVTLQR